MSDYPQPPHILVRRQVLNMHWPARPRSFKDHRPGIPVTVRIVWEGDGPEYHQGRAIRWDAGHVYVELIDKRLGGNGAWVKPQDVYRAEPDEDDGP